MSEFKCLRYDREGEDILCHHGILGQKWGVRRYQNPDGSLTEAGKKRYYKEYSEKALKSLEGAVLEKGAWAKDVRRQFVSRYSNERGKRKLEEDSENIETNKGNAREKTGNWIRDNYIDAVEDYDTSVKNLNEVKKFVDELKNSNTINESSEGKKYIDFYVSKLKERDQVIKDLDRTGKERLNKQDTIDLLTKVANEDGNITGYEMGWKISDLIHQKSGSWYDSGPVSEGFKDYLNKLHKEEDKLESIEEKYGYRSKKYNEAKDAFNNFRKNLEYELLGTVLKDLGFTDSKEARDLIDPFVRDD